MQAASPAREFWPPDVSLRRWVRISGVSIPLLAEPILQQEFLAMGSPDGARQAVRANIFYNVDLIKISIDNDVTQAEVTATVDEAHRQHLRVSVHAITQTAIQMAIDAGADSIEHGNFVTDEQLKIMRDKGIFLDLTPTFYDGLWMKIHEASIVMSPALRSDNVASDDRARQRAAAAGSTHIEVRRKGCGRLRHVLVLSRQIRAAKRPQRCFPPCIT